MTTTTTRILKKGRHSGREVVTTMTDVEVLKLACENNSDFAQSLVEKALGSLSPDQITWLHILAQQPALPNITSGAFMGIVEYFKAALRASDKYPSITINVNDVAVKLAPATPNSKYFGNIMVTDTGRYPDNTFFGTISVEGDFKTTKACSGDIIREIEKLSADPENYGKE